MESGGPSALVCSSSRKKYTVTVLEASLVASQAPLATPPTSNSQEKYEGFIKSTPTRPRSPNGSRLKSATTFMASSSDPIKISRTPLSPIRNSQTKLTRPLFQQNPDLPVSSRSPKSGSQVSNVRQSRSLQSPNCKELKPSKSPTSRTKSRRAELISQDKSREYLERLLARNMNVCYMTNLKNYIQKLKSNYNCDPDQCEMLQERLYNHRLQYHPEYFQEPDEMTDSKGNGVQTKITLANLGSLTISIESKPVSTSTSRNDVTCNDSLAERNGALSKRNDALAERYTQEISDEVKSWIKQIPFYPNKTNEFLQAKKHKIQNLIKYIHNLIDVTDGLEYEDKLKNYIDSFLDELDIWYPGPKRNATTKAFKEGFCEDLNERIKKINQYFLPHLARYKVGEDKIDTIPYRNPNSEVNDSENHNKTLSISVDKYGQSKISYGPKNDNKDDVVDALTPKSRLNLKPTIKSNLVNSNDDNRTIKNYGLSERDGGIYRANGIIENDGEAYKIEGDNSYKFFNETNVDDDNTQRHDSGTYINTNEINQPGQRHIPLKKIDNNYSNAHNKRNKIESLSNHIVGESTKLSIRSAEHNLNTGPSQSESKSFQPCPNSFNIGGRNNSGSNFKPTNVGENKALSEQGQNNQAGHYLAEQSSRKGSKLYEPNGNVKNLNSIMNEDTNKTGNGQVGNDTKTYEFKENNGTNIGERAKYINNISKKVGKSDKQVEGISRNDKRMGSNKNASTTDKITKNRQGTQNDILTNKPVKIEGASYGPPQDVARNIRTSKDYDTHISRNGPNIQSPISTSIKTNVPNNQTANYAPIKKNSESNIHTSKNDGPIKHNDTKYGTSNQFENDILAQMARKNEKSNANNRKQYSLQNLDEGYVNAEPDFGGSESYTVHRKNKDGNRNRSTLNVPLTQELNTYNPPSYRQNEMIPSSNIENKSLPQNYVQSIPTQNGIIQNIVPNYGLIENFPKDQKTPLTTVIKSTDGTGNDSKINIGRESVNGLGHDEHNSYKNDNFKTSRDEEFSQCKDLINNIPNLYCPESYTKEQRQAISSLKPSDNDKRLNNKPNLTNGLASKYSINGTISSPSLKCTLKSEGFCACPGDKKLRSKKRPFSSEDFDMEKEIAEWLKRSSIVKQDGLIDKQEIIDALLHHLGPYLSKPANQLNKAVLKGKLVNTLKGLGLCNFANSSKKVEIFKFCEDLANRLIGIQSRLECSGGGSWKCDVLKGRPFETLQQVTLEPNEMFKINLKQDLMHEVKQCLLYTQIANNLSIEEEITTLLYRKVDLIRKGTTSSIKKDVITILENTEMLQDFEITNIANNLIRNVKEIITTNDINDRTSFNTTIAVRPSLSGILSVYTSEHEISQPFSTGSTSTPKNRNNIGKINTKKDAYTEKIADKVRLWMTTVSDKFNLVSDDEMYEVMIYDLADEIFYHVKLEQLAPNLNEAKKSCLTFHIYKWLLKFGLLDDLDDAEPYTQDLVKKIQVINEPNLTRPFRRNRKKSLQDIRIEEKKHVVPEATDILKNKISIRANKQPPDIYANEDKSTRSEQIHELATKIRENFNKKQSTDNIENNKKELLNNLVLPNEKAKVDQLSDGLLNTKKSYQDRTKSNTKKYACKLKQSSSIKDLHQNSMTEDADAIMQKLIITFIEHDCETDDALTKGAYRELLTSELQRLNHVAGKAMSSLSSSEQRFSPEKLNKELEYIKGISDWITKLPLEDSFNTLHNKDRVKTVIGLAKNISDIEDERKHSPDAMDYNVYLGSTISQFMEQMPISKKERCNVPLMIDQLLTKIIAKRAHMPLLTAHRASQSIPEVIEEYIKTNGQEIADDELKSEACSARLLQEIKKKFNDDEGTSSVEDSITSRAIESGKQAVERFSLELDYAYHISDWLKNLPLVGPVEITTISELAKNMSEHDQKNITEKELVNFIKKWLLKLRLNPQKEVDIQLVVDQLMKRKEKVNNKITPQNVQTSSSSSDKSMKKPRNPTQSKKLSKSEHVTSYMSGNPGEMIVQVVENWCNNLPLVGATPTEINNIKSDIESKFFQTIAELNCDPRCSNNDSMYKVSLADEIDNKLSTLPQNITVKGKLPLEALKTELLDNIDEARLLIKNIIAGDNYKKQLEDTVEMSFPNPVQVRKKDAGFELYKSNLVEMFILDNFDHVNDAAKLKYRKRKKEEIDKYSHNAQDKNAVPLTSEQLFNNLYSALYTVPKPDYRSLGDEVEKIKTKYEIEDWYKTLPTIEPNSQDVLLDLNQKFSYLAQKLHQIEKGKNASTKMFVVISKWLGKIPLTARHEDDISMFANDLIRKLKNTQINRKCLKPSDLKSRDCKVLLNSGHIKVKQRPKSYDTIRLKTIGNMTEKVFEKSADIIIRHVEDFSNNIILPLNLPKEQAKMVKESLTTHIIIKICELNSDPSTFNEDHIYNHLLEQEINRLLSTIPSNDGIAEKKDELKRRLIRAVSSVKPIILEEKSRHDYRMDLDDTISHLLDKPESPISNQIANLTAVKEEIINNFIELLYNRDDEEARQFYKNKIFDAVAKYNKNATKNAVKNRAESLQQGNYFICELSKVPPLADKLLKDEVEEIKMKQEVNDFLNRISSPKHVGKNVPKNMLKNSLAKELNIIEKTGHTEINDEKMKSCVERYLKRLGYKGSNAKISAFIKKLRDTESLRKLPPLSKRTNGDNGLLVNFYQKDDQDFHSLTASKTYPIIGSLTKEDYKKQHQSADEISSELKPKTANKVHLQRPLLIKTTTEDAIESWNKSDSGEQHNITLQNKDAIFHDIKSQVTQSSHPAVPRHESQSSAEGVKLRNFLTNDDSPSPLPEEQSVASPYFTMVKQASPQPSVIPMSPKISPTRPVSPRMPTIQPPILIQPPTAFSRSISPHASFLNPTAQTSPDSTACIKSSSYQPKRSSVQNMQPHPKQLDFPSQFQVNLDMPLQNPTSLSEMRKIVVQRLPQTITEAGIQYSEPLTPGVTDYQGNPKRAYDSASSGPGAKLPTDLAVLVPPNDKECTCDRFTVSRKPAIPLLEYCKSCNDFTPFFRRMQFPYSLF